jgi:hypothetical protein
MEAIGGFADRSRGCVTWATGRHPERVPVNYLHGIPRFYEGADRAEIIWEDEEVDRFSQRAPELHADAVRLARETGLRIGDLVELERSGSRRPRTAAERSSCARASGGGASSTCRSLVPPRRSSTRRRYHIA